MLNELKIIVITTLVLLWCWLVFRKVRPASEKQASMLPALNRLMEFMKDLYALDRIPSQVERREFTIEEFYQRYMSNVNDISHTFDDIESARRAMYIRWVGTDEDYDFFRLGIISVHDSLNSIDMIESVRHLSFFLWVCLLCRLKNVSMATLTSKSAICGSFTDCYILAVQENISFNECLTKYPWINVLPTQRHSMIAISSCPLLKHAKLLPLPKDTFNFKVRFVEGAMSSVKQVIDEDDSLIPSSKPQTSQFQSTILNIISYSIVLIAVYSHLHRDDEICKSLLSFIVIVGFVDTAYGSYILMKSIKPPSADSKIISFWKLFISILSSILSSPTFLSMTAPLIFAAFYHCNLSNIKEITHSAEFLLLGFCYFIILEFSKSIHNDHHHKKQVMDGNQAYSEVGTYIINAILPYIPVFYAGFSIYMSLFIHEDLYYSFLEWNLLLLCNNYLNNGFIAKTLFYFVCIRIQEDLACHFLQLEVNSSWYWMGIVGLLCIHEYLSKLHTLGHELYKYMGYFLEVIICIVYISLLPSTNFEKLFEIAIVLISLFTVNHFEKWILLWNCLKFSEHLTSTHL